MGGPLTSDELRTTLEQIAAAHGLRITYPRHDAAVITRGEHDPGNLTLRWRPHLPPVPDTQEHNLEPEPHLEILIDSIVKSLARLSAKRDSVKHFPRA